MALVILGIFTLSANYLKKLLVRAKKLGELIDLLLNKFCPNI